MHSVLRPAITLLLATSLLTGVAYPLAVTGLAQLAFPHAAHGSLVKLDGRVIGSSLIAQRFADRTYFHPRPSAASFDAAASSGSNYGPTSKALLTAVTERTQVLAAENPGVAVPLALVTTSASGLDPDLSPAAADFQVPRIAAARGLDPEQLRKLIAEHTQGPQLGILGEARVNVLLLNLALDAA
ncbi:MAG: potassium-transporting ATPase subunit KdpC [Panacagrimonas sp.]